MRFKRPAAAIALPILVLLAAAAGVAALLSLPGGPAVAPIGACSLACGGSDDPCPHPIRVDARRISGRIEIAIREEQGIEPSCETIWSNRWLPPRRYAPAPELVDAWLIDRWLNSTPLATIGSEVRVSLRIRGDRSVEYALQQRVFGEWRERRSLAEFLPADAREGEWHESEILDFIPAYKPSYPNFQPPFTLERDKQYAAVLEMEDGSEIAIELFADDAPLTANWFVFLAREGYYDGLRFDSIATGSHAYAGNVLNYRHLKIPYEFSGRPNNAGAVGMAPRVNPDDYDGEFYIKMSDEGELPVRPPWSVGRFFADPYFVFGRVVRGLDAVRAFPSVDRAEHEIGPLIRTIRIDERPREIPQPEPGIIPSGFRAGTAFDRNRLGDPDAPVLLQRFTAYSGTICPNCFYSFSYIEPQLFEALIVTGIARYEVIPIRQQWEPFNDHALACAADQGKFWELSDGLSTLDNVRYLYPFNIDDYAAALGMDAAEFRACIDERRNADEVEAWHRQADAAGMEADSGDAWFVDGVLVEQPEHWPAHAEAIIEAAAGAR